MVGTTTAQFDISSIIPDHYIEMEIDLEHTLRLVVNRVLIVLYNASFNTSSNESKAPKVTNPSTRGFADTKMQSATHLTPPTTLKGDDIRINVSN